MLESVKTDLVVIASSSKHTLARKGRKVLSLPSAGANLLPQCRVCPLLEQAGFPSASANQYQNLGCLPSPVPPDCFNQKPDFSGPSQRSFFQDFLYWSKILLFLLIEQPNRSVKTIYSCHHLQGSELREGTECFVR